LILVTLSKIEYDSRGIIDVNDMDSIDLPNVTSVEVFDVIDLPNITFVEVFDVDGIVMNRIGLADATSTVSADVNERLLIK